jgi:hypothetical protein
LYRDPGRKRDALEFGVICSIPPCREAIIATAFWIVFVKSTGVENSYLPGAVRFTGRKSITL